MKNNIALVFVILAAVALTAILLLWPGPEKGSVAESGEGIKAIVSILPQKEFVRSVGGNHVSVKELIPPGASPATYDLSPQDLVAIEDADIYFRIGHIPFEKSHLEKIGDINPGLVIVDTSESVPLRGFGGEEAHDHEEGLHGNEEEEVHIHEGADPHIWLSPALVKLQVESIYDALAKEDPANVEEYRANADAYLERLDSLDSGLEGAFKDVGTDVLMVFHPAWGYFADAYGLEQIAIEKEGKEPIAFDHDCREGICGACGAMVNGKAHGQRRG